ncbi:hypothetical protein E2C01_038522 [Portunus trituberculatus]|uniref:Uncharacterized protein n=1 Tax=Portunus trituberculatus TaxID=210409 RepID=A0A5B7FED4_PORTR|nr:hypothetical protein [Portunus trituberculatus]
MGKIASRFKLTLIRPMKNRPNPVELRGSYVCI